MSAFNDPEFLYTTAEQLVSEGKFNAAELLLRQAVELGGEHSEIYAAGLATLIGLQEGRAEESLEYLKGQLMARPDNPNLMVAYGLTARAAGLDEEAESSFRAAVEKNPDHPMALHSLSRILIDQGHLQEAEKMACKAFALVPDHAEFALTAIELLDHLGKADVAYEVASLSAGFNADEMEIVQKAVEGALARQQPDRAWDALKDAAQELPWVLGWKATLLEHQGRTEESDVLLDKGRELFPDDLNLWFLEAAIWLKRGNADNAIPLIEKILEEDPTNKGALKMRSDLNFEHASIDDAIRDLEQVQDMEPDDPSTGLDLISAYYAARRYSDCMELCSYWERRQRDEPDLYVPPQIRVFGCLACASLGDTQEALQRSDWILDDFLFAAITELNSHGTGSPGEEAVRRRLMERLPEPEPIDPWADVPSEGGEGVEEEVAPPPSARPKAELELPREPVYAGLGGAAGLIINETDDEEYEWVEVDDDDEEYEWVEVDEDDDDPDAEYEWVDG